MINHSTAYRDDNCDRANKDPELEEPSWVLSDGILVEGRKTALGAKSEAIHENATVDMVSGLDARRQ